MKGWRQCARITGQLACGMVFSLLCACSNTLSSTSNLTELSDDALCMALGDNIKNGTLTLRIIKEIHARPEMDNERCYALERKSLEQSEEEFKARLNLDPNTQRQVDDLTRERPIVSQKERSHLTPEMRQHVDKYERVRPFNRLDRLRPNTGGDIP